MHDSSSSWCYLTSEGQVCVVLGTDDIHVVSTHTIGGTSSDGGPSKSDESTALKYADENPEEWSSCARSRSPKDSKRAGKLRRPSSFGLYAVRELAHSGSKTAYLEKAYYRAYWKCVAPISNTLSEDLDFEHNAIASWKTTQELAGLPSMD